MAGTELKVWKSIAPAQGIVNMPDDKLPEAGWEQEGGSSGGKNA